MKRVVTLIDKKSCVNITDEFLFHYNPEVYQTKSNKWILIPIQYRGLPNQIKQMNSYSNTIQSFTKQNQTNEFLFQYNTEVYKTK